ncbi:hypothetical protein A3C59_01260 [Candidatus Daviesbacteria bacterium RIFCSPHIGHO2_02_FULL_36_13]|uniref:Plasmid stabilization protein n=1 Tax=Candidatus Daviesbacteria bacterium RIFCSPHIGHO2_02_FULL_36_13 TaxID=1797768 RepID=A0A1F5JX51_9BACT|nr:MAG: hypothetical protein A3C59_01260 [Candidatus Daviesbacteria bacterium RIFCSPHIGHO2_02_FULL_36_13]
MKVKPLNPRLAKYLRNHNLIKKFDKQLTLLLENPKHPSLNTELLEPKHMRVYSFRIDRKYRVNFGIVAGEIEVFDITIIISRVALHEFAKLS